MIDNETREFIIHKVYEILEEYNLDEEEIISILRREISEEYLPMMKGYRERMTQIEDAIQAHAVGVQNVYNEVEKVIKKIDMMKDLQDRCENETLPIDEVQLLLWIKSYPMNIRTRMKIETNFGEISYIFDCPLLMRIGYQTLFIKYILVC